VGHHSKVHMSGGILGSRMRHGGAAGPLARLEGTQPASDGDVGWWPHRNRGRDPPGSHNHESSQQLLGASLDVLSVSVIDG
jgi:hypothetical protein